MRTVILLLMLSSSAFAGMLPNDKTLSHRLVGTWHGARHNTRYFPDNTWMMDPQNYVLLQGQNTHGRWSIKNGQLIETWRFNGETEDSGTVAQINVLTAHVLKFHTLSQGGPGALEGQVLPSSVYTLTRIFDATLPGH